jgi:hypothetical protein
VSAPPAGADAPPNGRPPAPDPAAGPDRLSAADLAHLTDLLGQQRALEGVLAWFTGRLRASYGLGPGDRLDPADGRVLRGASPAAPPAPLGEGGG